VNINQDQELLESFLDDELPGPQRNSLRNRIAASPSLAAELEICREQRTLRESFFASLEGDALLAERLIQKLPAPSLRFYYLRRALYGTGAAACLALSFLAGRMGATTAGKSQVVIGPTPQHFIVEIRDDAGETVGIQKFESLEKAEEFSKDIEGWQQRQEQRLAGNVVVRSALF
jgi:anti-sigma factor RsiW